MLDQNITTLLSTLLGGLLTVAGGVVGSYYIQLSSNKSNKKKEIRNMIESLYRDMQSLENICMTLKKINPATRDWKVKYENLLDEAYEKTQHMELLGNLYLKPIEVDAREYRINVLNFLALVTTCFDARDFDKLSQIPYKPTNLKEALQKLLKKEGYTYF